MSKRIPAEVFPPGDFIREEIEERGWTQGDLAEILGRPPRLVNELIAGKKRITPETARGLGEAFGTGAMYWMKLESTYRLSQAKPIDDAVARRAHLYSRFPVREMLKRGWIELSDNVDMLEASIIRFYGLRSVEDPPALAHAAKATDYAERTGLQWAWLHRARQLGEAVAADHYSETKLLNAIDQLKLLLESPEEIRHVPRVLATAGVRLVVVEFLPGSKIDGATIWLNRKKPIIALSLRFDRIDNFWFVLRHEIEHVLRRHGEHGVMLDEDMFGGDGSSNASLPLEEQEANMAAEQFLVSPDELQDFISRTRPLYYEKKIVGFARRMGIHPGLVVGQLQWQKELPYTHLKKYLVKIRHIICPNAITDGWGHIPVIDDGAGD